MLWFPSGDVGDEPPHWEGLINILSQGVPKIDGEATSAMEGQRVGIPSNVERDGRGGTAEGDTHICTVPCGMWEAIHKFYQDKQVNRFIEALLWFD